MVVGALPRSEACHIPSRQEEDTQPLQTGLGEEREFFSRCNQASACVEGLFPASFIAMPPGLFFLVIRELFRRPQARRSPVKDRAPDPAGGVRTGPRNHRTRCAR